MRVYIQLFIYLAILIVRGQEANHEFVFEYLTAKDGLAHNYVSKVVSDSLNIKWIGTENGLSKYDGNEFTSIRPSDNFPNLKNENIETLLVDSFNNLWIGTKSGGLSVLDIESNTMDNLNSILSKNENKQIRITEILEDKNKHIWVGTQKNGVFIIDPIKKVLIRKFTTNRTLFLLKDKNEDIWFNKYDKLIKYSIKTGKIEAHLITTHITNGVYDLSRNCIWLTTFQKDQTLLVQYDLENNTTNTRKTKIPKCFVGSLYVDDDNHLWIGTWRKGLYISNNDVTTFAKKELSSNVDSNKNAKYDIILDIHKDNTGVIWIASNYGGLIKLTKSRGFYNLSNKKENKLTAGQLNIKAVYQDSSKIYVGTASNGLFVGQNLSQLKRIKQLKDKRIFSIQKIKKTLFVGTLNALYLFDENLEIYDTIDLKKTTSILEIDDTKILIGTEHKGLKKLTYTNNKEQLISNYFILDFEEYIESNLITQIKRDYYNNIWVGTYNGFYLYDDPSETFTHYAAFTNDKLPKIINCIYPDMNFLWLGTPSGLYKMKQSDKVLSLENTYAIDQGFKDPYICGIVGDQNNHLWITTATHLVHLDPIKNSLENFGEKDGINISQYNKRAIISDLSSGIIYTGGSDNLSYFNSENITSSTSEVAIIFSSLKVNNKIVAPNKKVEGKVILTKDISYTSKIELSHLHKSFGLKFTSSNFTENQATRYRYRIKGIDEQWNYLKNQQEINFVGLPPRSYTLEISASLNALQWSPSKKIDIVVLHTPWKSPVAFLAYIFFTIVFLFKFGETLLRNRDLKKNRIVEKEISDAKFTFFTNISHEFRTPLTLIVAPLKELLHEGNITKPVLDKVKTIDKNANRLLELINQLLDFRKAEHGLLELQKEREDIASFTKEIFKLFKDQAKIKNIKYSFKDQANKQKVFFDKIKMEIVICNLLSNAFKHTHEGGAISLIIESDENHYYLSVKDSGKGINNESKKMIFERFYQIKDTDSMETNGSGIGLTFSKKIVELHDGTISVESELNKGSIFKIKIPFVKEEKVNKVVAKKKSKKTIKNHDNTLLIVDDNTDIQNYLTSLLEKEYDILIAKDGQEGFEIANEELPDLILSDIMMPRKNGLELSKEIKNNVSTAHIPVILLTARSADNFEIQSLEKGADAFIAKPFDPNIIKAKISSTLANSKHIAEHLLNKARFTPDIEEEDIEPYDKVFIKKAIALIEDNIGNPDFDGKSLEDAFFMSKSTLYRKIKAETDHSTSSFIRSIKLKKAAEMILTTTDKLSNIAKKVGFNDTKYFRESFKKQFNTLPSNYRKQFKDNNTDR